MLRRYMRWLHTGWPAGSVEKLPRVAEDGTTNVPGVYVVGDLTGIPLLKFSADTGAKAVQAIAADAGLKTERKSADEDVRDLIILGGGVAGMAAALEARKAGLDFVVLEAAQPFATIQNFPKGKPIFTYPTDMEPAGDMHFHATVKEDLVAELKAQTLEQGIEVKSGRASHVERRGGVLEVVLGEDERLRALRVIVAIGRSGNYRRLGVPGEDLDKVINRLHDPKDHAGKRVMIVGGGDSALEGAIALVQAGAAVTLSYRKPEFSRPKPENQARIQALIEDPDAEVDVESPASGRVGTATGAFSKERLAGRLADDKVPPKGSLTLKMATSPTEVREDVVVLKGPEGEEEVPNDTVFAMIGREPPLDFFRRSGIDITGELTAKDKLLMALFVGLMAVVYSWKGGGESLVYGWVKDWNGFPFNLIDRTPETLVGSVISAASSPGFWYSAVYCGCVLIFGVARIRRRRTPYVTLQTATLMAFQLVPLFLLPYVILPWMGANGWFEEGLGKSLADSLFPDSGGGREYWRSFGLILAWPLFIWNVFTDEPNAVWLAISLLQTCVLIPGLIYFYGKGAYCGWICSCGALAETLGDTHRQKMPHGPFWNRLNMIGQLFLAVALLMLGLRVAGWVTGSEVIQGWFKTILSGPGGYATSASESGWWWNHLSYRFIVDTLFAGTLGVGLYFWYSGRVWCRFACPLAALMHVYTRFSRFRILADKKKCISCNVCTSVCHQGIDVMNFANKGLPMADPECVRCSACVQSCPTGVLEFGQIDLKTGEVLKRDSVPASPVLMAEREAERQEV